MLFSISKLLLLIIAISVDAFAAGFSYGTDKVRIPPLSAFIVALISDFLLILSLFFGNLFTTYLSPPLTTALSFTILFALGIIKLFDSAIKKKIREKRFHRKELHVTMKNLRFILTVYAQPEEANTDDIEVLSPTEALSLGLALSLDSAAAGLGAAAGLKGVSGICILPLTALLTLFIGISAVSGGCLIGRKLSAKSDFNFSMIGGILLLLLAFSKL